MSETERNSDNMIIDRVMARMGAGVADGALLARLAARAMAHSQKKPFSLMAALGLDAAPDWQFGFMRPALILGLIAIACFGGGVTQSYGKVGAPNEEMVLTAFEYDEAYNDLEAI